jgi:protein gp37
MYTNKVNMGYVRHWHPWVGCKKVSAACRNCFVKQQGQIVPSKDFTPPRANYGDVIVTCLHSDFFIAEADRYREKAWNIIKNHPEQIFLIITKRVERIMSCLPKDWGDGYDNVVISVTAENQKWADYRLPIFLQVPAKHKWISCCPLLESINLEEYLKTGAFEWVETCGEIGKIDLIRPTYFEWVANLSDQCKKENVRFTFMKIGGKFVVDGQTFSERATCYHSPMADQCDLDNAEPINFVLNGKPFTIL